MKTGATIVKDNLKQALADIEKLTRKQVLIGVPSSTTSREGPINNATIGYIQEYGAPEVNIPARPHLVPGVAAIEDKAADMLGGAAKKALAGDSAVVDATLEAIGLMGVSSVREHIRDGDFVPLKEATLKARRRRGRSGTKPLVDTGEYIKAQNYVIREKGK